MIRVLVLLECVLLMIIGFDKVIGVSTPDGPGGIGAPSLEASSEMQIGTMRSAIVPSAAAAAGPQPVVSVLPDGEAHSILPLSLPEADASISKQSYSELFLTVFDYQSMREADRMAITRELLGSVVDDPIPSAPTRIIGDIPVAESVTNPLAHAAIASRPKPPVFATTLPAQPVARPEVPTKLASMNTVVPLVQPRGKTDPGAPSTATITEAQRLLTRLGYHTGIDGVLGKRTELAISSFQQRRGGIVDGRISDALVVRLRAAVRNENADPSPNRRRGYDLARRPEHVDWVSSLVAGYQRLIGHRFDSIARPRELRSYCRLQSDNWVFDEGSGRLVHCGRIATAAN